jgi:transcriptional regulator with XRE-family HTH domain
MIPDQLKRVRKHLGLSQGGFANWLCEKMENPAGVARSTITHWERGTRPIPAWLSALLKCWEIHRR